MENAEHYERFSQPLLTQIPELYLPFTADIGSDSELDPAGIRDFWTRVLAAILRGDESDVALRFYKYLLSISEIPTPAPVDSRYQRDNFLFLDTVVSGRAITNIFDSFEKYGLHNCHFILLVDECGRRMQAPFDRQIRQMEAEGRATLINVEKIFTEDEGPSVSGIWTITFPSVMEQLPLMIPELGGAVGAALYFTEVRKRPDDSNLAITKSNSILSTLLYSALDGRRRDSQESFLDEYKEHISESGLQDQTVTKQIATPFARRFPGVTGINVSSSHVVRAELDSAKAERLIRAFRRGEPYRGN